MPWKLKIHVAGYKSKSVRQTNKVLLNESFQEYVFLDHVHIVAKHVEPYYREYVSTIIIITKVSLHSARIIEILSTAWIFPFFASLA